ncbi:M23 family metallopeptidase [Paludicola sp. MB14-C6]|uniref:M23 family metallopeptidase n=1 Tax=Paludihabitans sp. MB14-C6 TaxID=3070656 RepID=UPI0027DBD60A|nr:M23 family metallopeptidase [Paludicola sp. MB14-C6]WMJ21805.1 M23 family metallopeptidase [Paludicola sp. MB14-C6]
MKKAKIGKASTKSFFSGKGFYVALAVSLIAIGGAAWLGLNSAMNKLDKNNTMDLDKTPSQIQDKDDEWDIPKQVTKPQSDVNATVSDNASNVVAKENYILPLKGTVANAYSGDKVVKSKTLDEWVMHTGIDIKAAVSTPVKAIASGVVKEVKNDDMWGTCVVIDHGNGIVSHYYNLKTAVNVKVKQEVKLGDVIGSVGQTADIERAEESHLHFAVQKNGEWIDPLSIIK